MPLGRQQPLDVYTDQSRPGFVAGWLNKGVIPLGAARDIGPDAYDMTRVGKPVEERVGMTFDGTNYLRSVVGAPFRAGDSQGTVLAWIKLDAVGLNQTIFASCDEGSTNRYFQLRVRNDNYLAIYQSNATGVSAIRGGTALLADQWYRVAVVSDGSVYALCVNGQAETLVVASGANDGDWLADTDGRDNVTIGVRRVNALAHYFDGTIKDVQYHSTPLSADEIAYDYARCVPDDDLRLSVDGRGVDLTRYEMPFAKVANVIVGHEQSYDGAADYLKATTPAWRLPDQAGSLAAWVRCADLTKGMAIFASCDEGTDNYIFEWIITNAGVQFVYVFENGVLVGSATGTTVLTQDLWQRVMITSDGSDYLFYVNGVADPLTGGPNENGAWLADVTLRDNVTVGGLEYNSGLILPWEGQISYVKYYSRVLPADEEWDTYRVEEGAY